MQKINKLALALSLAAVFGICMVVFSVWHALSLSGGGSFGREFMAAFQSIHPSSFQYQQPLAFVLVNTAYAVMDGFIMGFLLALLYNRASSFGSAKRSGEESGPDVS